MQLDENQKKTVAGWIEEGLDLSAIQSRLESEMDIPMTYMDVRFLVGDLELVPKDEEEPEEEAAEELAATPEGDGEPEVIKKGKAGEGEEPAESQ